MMCVKFIFWDISGIVLLRMRRNINENTLLF